MPSVSRSQTVDTGHKNGAHRCLLSDESGICFDNTTFKEETPDAVGIENEKHKESTDLILIKDKSDQILNYGAAFVNGEGDRASLISEVVPRVSRRRWLILMLFCVYTFSNSFQWIHLNIIADILARYYNQSLPNDTYQRNTAIDWLSLVYMFAYIPLIFPATWILNKKGLRFCCICGSFLNATGAWLKCASVSPDRFALLMFGQTLCAIAQVCVLGIPARLSAVWFGPNEVSTATSLGVFGNQVGIAVGMFLPPIIITSSNNMDAIGADLSTMCYGTAGFTTAIFLLILTFFHDKPLYPPSRAQHLAVLAATSEHHLQSILRLIRNKGFILLTVAYGVNCGSLYALSTLLNVIVLTYFPGQGESVGRIGLTILLMGVLGSIIAGIWLDKTKTFKGTTSAIYILTLAGTVAFTLTLDLNMIWTIFVASGFLGFFMAGYIPVGFEFAAELTFPESEGTSSGLLNTSAQVFGITFTLAMRAMLDSISVLSANISVCVCLLLGNIITAVIKPDYRRQKAGERVAQVFNKKYGEIIIEEATSSIPPPVAT